MTQTKPKNLPDREALRVKAAELLQQPAGYIVEGPTLEGSGYSAPELKHMFEEALLEQRMGQALQTARKGRGLSGSELARRLGVTPMRVHQLERVQGNVELQTLARVADALNYDLTLILTPREGGASIQVKAHSGR